ncbi:DUF1929 domain-containing protein [Candidatus Saccharibacteria bacterium]|nr:DUF1929 domain-containing protein [Candidatus Saccharibacteria bacterium]
MKAFQNIRSSVTSSKRLIERAKSAALVSVAVLIAAAGTGIFTLPAPVAMAAPAALVNPGLEQTTGTTPNCFTQAGWGQHTVNWAITADAHSGTKAQSVTISNYVNGDRKLMMTESDACGPAATPGTAYKLSVWYKSTSARNSLTVFRHSAAGWAYWTDLAAPTASTTWKQVSVNTPVVPAGTDQIAFGLSLSGNGTLVTDDYGFEAIGGTTPTNPTPTNPTPTNPTPTTGELTKNPGLELGGNPPADWFVAGWGNANLQTAVVGGAHGGTRAHSITLSGRTEGDYKLLPTEAASPAVTPGDKYNLSAWYKSTTASNSVTVFAHTAAGWGYWTDLKTVPAATAWTQMTATTPAIPAGVDAIAWGITIYGNGTLITDDYSTTKVAATTTPTTPTTPPATGNAANGQWSVMNYNIPVRSSHATVLKNGKVLLIAGSGNDLDAFNAGSFKASIWDPISGTFITLDVPKDMFCAGHVTLGDGRVLIQGGTKSYPSTPGGGDYGGLKDSWIFNPDTNTFTATNDANEGHWYPTLTQLGDGDIWMAGGLKEDTSGAVNTEKFDVETGRWLPGDQVAQSWSFWGLYPHMYLMGDGRLFYSGGHVFGNGLPGTGASIYNPNTGAIADVPGLRGKDMRDQSSSILLPPAQDQKVLITGGGNIDTQNPGINLTDIIDLKAANPAYVPGPNLPGEGKMYVNGTTLPDRTVLFSNGSRLNRDDATNVLSAAIYDPATNTMRSVAADPIGRNYHSTAVLLPDGRVVAMGSNPGDGTFEMRISVYQPSYLFKTARPTISGVPAETTYGQQFKFNVNVASGKTVKWAQLTRPMSVTHQMDANMRLVDLPVSVAGGVATVNVTANRNMLPPGPYMLTVTDSDGVPSTAAWVLVK